MSSSLSDDDEFFHEWAQQRKKALEQTVDPSAVVVEFLKKTKIPYAIIGGKAAAFHLNAHPSGSPSAMALALSTNDYDILIQEQHKLSFLSDLYDELRQKSRTGLDQKLYESRQVDIIMIGMKKQDMFDSIVDVHIVKSTSKEFPKIVKDKNGLKYANIGWICKELQYSMKYHASNDELTKTMKRKARYDLLQCS